jgi:hypothetical protein
MENWRETSGSEITGFILGGFVYTGAWLSIFGSVFPPLFFLWIVFGAVALGGLAGFALGQGRLITPLLIALIVLFTGLIPSFRGPDVPSGSPGELSLVFLFGWPLLLGVSGLSFHLENAIRE